MNDFAQTFLIGKIKTYLINHGRKRMAEELSPGYCAGLTVLFLYLISQGRLEQFKQLLTYLAQWSPEGDKIIAERIAKLKLSEHWQAAENKLNNFLTREPQKNNLSYDKQMEAAFLSGDITRNDMEILRQAILPEDPMIEKLFGFVEWIQQHSKYTDLEFRHYVDKQIVDVIHMDAELHEFEKRIYENSLVVNYKNLVEIIENLPENSPIFLGSFDHAFAIYKMQGMYYLYESNYGALPAPTSNPEAVASKLARETYHDRSLGHDYAIKLVITSHSDSNKTEIMLLEAKVNEIIQKKPRDFCALDGTSAVLMAVKNSQHEILASRIARGDDVNLAHECGLYPIHLANDIISLELLLAAGANVNQPIKTTEALLDNLTSETVLYYRSLEGATPLYVSAGHGTPEIIERLIQSVADVNAASFMGLTPLMNASKNGKLKNVKMLLKNRADVAMTIGQMRASSAMISGIHDNSGMLSYVAGGLKTNQFEGYNAAMLAAQFLHTDVTNELLQNGTDPNYQTDEGESLLTIACTQGDVKLLQELINRGVPLTKTKTIFNAGEATPLYLSCRHGHIRCVELMLTEDANIVSNNTSAIPAILGASLNNNPEIIRLLQANGADIEVHFQNKSPLSWSITRGMLASAECLIDLGAKLTKEIVDFDVLIAKDYVEMLLLVMRHVVLSDKEQLQLLEDAIDSSAIKCLKQLLNNHMLLSDEDSAYQFIQMSLTKNGSQYLCLAEVIAHCLLNQKYQVNFEKLKDNGRFIPTGKKIIIEYFEMAIQGDPLKEILHHLIDGINFNNKTNEILHQAVDSTDTLDKLIITLLDKSKEISDIDHDLCDMFFKTIKEVIYQYPPEIFSAKKGLTFK